MDFSRIGVRLLVRDYGKMFDFYKDVMGLSVVWGDRSGPYTSFAAPGHEQEPNFAIFAAQDMEMLDGFKLRPAGDGMMLVLPCKNVDAEYERLLAAGVSFVGPPQTMEEWGMRCTVLQDPEGNRIELNDSGSA